jgi:hypothetical protein
VEKTNNRYKCQDLCSNKVLEVDVTRLKKWTTDADMDNRRVAAADDGKYLVEAIVGHKRSGRRKSGLKFKVRWLGYEPEEDTWEPNANVKDLEALKVYLKIHPELRL